MRGRAVSLGPPPPPEGPIKAAFIPAEDINVVMDGEEVVITAQGVERVRLSQVGAMVLSRLIQARGLE